MTDTLRLADARLIVDTVLARAAEDSLTITVNVVDARGEELASARMDGAPWFTAGVARTKARSAAVMGSDTVDLEGLRSSYPDLLPLIDEQLPFTLTVLEGGVVVQLADVTVGGVGVSGALPAQDVACARAGVAAWLSAR
jgi:glc operon protein GlcG